MRKKFLVMRFFKKMLIACRKPETLDDLFREYSGDYNYLEISTGPVGDEVW